MEVTESSERTRISQKLAIEEFWRIPWQDFDVTLGNINSLQIRNLSIKNLPRANEFLHNCGFNIENPGHLKSFQAFYGEALYMLRHIIMTPDEREIYKIPNELLYPEDPAKIILLAGERAPRKRFKRLMACAVLKIVFAIANLEYGGRLKEVHEARKQIFTKIKHLIHIDEEHKICVKKNDICAEIKNIDWKEAKTRASTILKFLHKPESVADDVFDYLGVRFVVKREHDIPLLLKILVDSDIIIPHQVVTTRSRNTLLNISRAKQLLDILTSLLSMDVINMDEFQRMCKEIPWTYALKEDSPRAYNVHSSSFYKSLHLTVRHLIRTPNPTYLVVESLLNQVRHYRGMSRDDSTMAGLVPAEVAKFFPIEIQIMDEANYDQSRFGSASHEQYKSAQLGAVRKHVLSSLLSMTPEKLISQEM